MDKLIILHNLILLILYDGFQVRMRQVEHKFGCTTEGQACYDVNAI